jgi:hypothetical protein
MRMRKWSWLVLVALIAPFVPTLRADAAYTNTAPQGCASSTSGDFDGDGHGDLAVGVPGEDSGQGGVNVIYGDDPGTGLDDSAGPGDQFFRQGSSLADTPETNDHFGACLVSGNFNGDGFDDLAIGVPNESVGSIAGAGAVHVIYGSDDGLDPAATTHADQFFTQNTSGIEGSSETGDHFGSALAAGDFNSDERDDLAIGEPDEDVGSTVDAGSVNVIYGSTTGLSASSPLADQIWAQDSAGISGASEKNDHMGASLATGDINGDGREDLAIGDPGEGIGTKSAAGAVNVLYGSVSSGLNANNDQLWYQDSTGVLGVSEKDDQFGNAVTIGDFDANGFGDLAVGVPFEDAAADNDGAVNVLYGSPSRLTATSDAVLFGPGSDDDHFGAALAAGDFDLDANEDTDLAVGVPGASSDAGEVDLFSGDLTSAGTLTSADADAGSGDAFGAALAAGDYDGDTFADLSVGAPLTDVGTTTDSGSVSVFYGGLTGLGGGVTSDQFWNQDVGSIFGTADDDDHFGASVG